MRLSTLLVAQAAITLVLGIVFVLMPATVLSPFALLATGPDARSFGTSSIGIDLICWLCRPAEPQALPGITPALFLSDLVGTMVTLVYQLAGLINALGRTIVAIYLLLTVALGNFRLVKPVASCLLTRSGAMWRMWCSSASC